MGATEKNAIYIVVFAIIVGGIAQVMKRSLPCEHDNPYRIPVDIGPWKGKNVDADLGSIASVIGAHDIIFRAYRNGIDVVVLYIAYYKDIDAANSVHAPEVCYEGQGWLVAEDDVVSRRLGNARAKINRLVIRKAREQELVYTWWQTGRRVIPRNSINRFYQLFLTMSGRNPSTLWVRLSINRTRDLKLEEESMIRFCGDLKPFLEATPQLRK